MADIEVTGYRRKHLERESWLWRWTTLVVIRAVGVLSMIT
jgi:hypothetical protein